MPAQHQRLDRQQQSLNPQMRGVDTSSRIDDMQSEALEHAELSRRDQFVIAGVSIGDTTAAWRHALETAFVDWGKIAHRSVLEQGVAPHRGRGQPRHEGH
jgi:hypothetical protein